MPVFFFLLLPSICMSDKPGVLFSSALRLLLFIPICFMENREPSSGRPYVGLVAHTSWPAANQWRALTDPDVLLMGYVRGEDGGYVEVETSLRSEYSVLEGRGG
jgi:hypothetical protein